MKSDKFECGDFTRENMPVQLLLAQVGHMYKWYVTKQMKDTELKAGQAGILFPGKDCHSSVKAVFCTVFSLLCSYSSGVYLPCIGESHACCQESSLLVLSDGPMSQKELADHIHITPLARLLSFLLSFAPRAFPARVAAAVCIPYPGI